MCETQDDVPQTPEEAKAMALKYLGQLKFAVTFEISGDVPTYQHATYLELVGTQVRDFLGQAVRDGKINLRARNVKIDEPVDVRPRNEHEI